MANFPEKQPCPWGTWEDLLLSCAVARHGADSWDAVAAELRNRSSSSAAALSPRTCRHKFHDLRRRFSPDDAAPASFLDELRRLRVAELRREVERHDLSIESLETRVEKLKEERERSPTADPDPDPAAPLPETSVSGEKAAEKETVVEDSYDGSSETVAKKEPAKEKEEIVERVGGGGGDSAESKEENGERLGGGDSAESKEESSTSLARKKVEEPEEEEEEPERSEDGKRAHSGSVESQSLVGFLEILRSHKAGSLFESRLEIQEVLSYSNTIRQHIDFETVRMRLEEGRYSNCKSKFFRDLMLIITNATVFFDKKAPISVAAAKLRPIVQREMAAHAVKPESAVKEESPVPEEKPDPQLPPETLVRKPKISVPMSACRKRSSIAARAASTSSSGPAVGWKPNEKSAEKAAEEVPAIKKGKKDKDKAKASTKSNNSSKAGTGTGTSRSVAESGKNAAGNASSGPSTRGGGGSSNENSASKPEKKESGNGSGKKQSAANFLNRMKRASPAVEPPPPKDSGGGGSRGGVTEPKKNNGGKGSSGSKQKEPSTPPPPARRGSGSNTKQAKEPESPAKRSVGRPSKRPAAPSPAPPAKRNKPSGESEVAASRNAKKRSRK